MVLRESWMETPDSIKTHFNMNDEKREKEKEKSGRTDKSGCSLTNLELPT